MRIPRIHTPQLLSCGALIELEEQASSHLSRVLRLKEGHPLVLFNGEGGQYSAKIHSIAKKTLQAEVLEHNSENFDSPLRCHIAVALAKADKMELIVQKATELGVCSIQPLISARSDIKLNPERLEKKIKQWQQISISACEQSGRNSLVEILPLLDLHEWLGQSTAQSRSLFHPTDEQGKSISLQQLAGAPEMGFCFGSEGGFSDAEIQLARQNNCHIVSLGPRVLRAETAPIAVLGAAQILWGDW